MRRLLKKYRWVFLFISIMILIGMGSFYFVSMKLNLKKLSQDLIKKYSNLNISFEEINIENIRTIKLTNVVWKEKSKHKLVEAQDVIVDFSILKMGKISNIKIRNAVINYDMYEDYKSNFINELTATNNQDEKNNSNKNSEDGNFIDKITILNSQLKFTDFSHEKLVTKKLDNVNGYIDFKNKDLDIKFQGKMKEEMYKIDINLNDGNLENLILELESVKINNTLMQYTPTLDLIDYKSGIIDVKIEMKNGNISGIGSLTGGDIKYIDFENRIKKVNGSIKFGSDFASIKANGYVNGENIKTDLNYQNENFNIILKTDRIDFNTVNNYKMVQEMELPISGIIKNPFLKYNSQENILDLKLESENLEIFDMNFKNITGDFQIKDKDIKINNLELKNENFFDANIKFQGDFINSNLYGDYSIKSFNQENIINPMDFKGSIDYNLDTKKIKLNSYNSDFNLKAKYNQGDETGVIDLDISNSKKIRFQDYEFGVKGYAYLEFDKMKIQDAKFNSVKISNILYGYDLNLDGSIKDQKIILKKGEISKGDTYVHLDGNYNLETGKYTSEIKQGEINLEDIPKEYLNKYEFLKKNSDKDLNIQGDFEGVKLQKSSAIIYYNISEFDHIVNFNDIRGNLNFEYEDDILISGNSQIRNMQYKKQNIKDVVLEFSYEKDELRIYKFRNNSLGINGIIDINKKELDLRYNINNYTLSDLVNLEEYNIKVNSISGRIKDSFDSPRISGNIDGILRQNFGSDISLKGDIIFQDNIISFDKFKLNNNAINGTVNLINEDVRLRINLFEDNFSNIYDTEKLDNINFRVLGEIDLWGKFSDLEGVGIIKLDNIFYRDVNIPDLSIDFNYNKGNISKILETGVISFSKFSLKGDEDQDLLAGSAFWNLENNDIKLNLSDEINLKELNYPDIYGTINTEVNFQKSKDEYEYDFKISSKSFGWGEIKVKDLNSEIRGNNKSIKIEELKAFYNDNKIQVNGGMNLDPLTYDFQVDAAKMDLELFSFLIKDYGKDMDGTADINLDINSNNSEGEIKVSNFKISSIDNKFKLKNSYFDLKIDRSKIILENFSGEFNQGNLTGQGTIDMEISDLEDISLTDIDIDIADYNFDTDFKKIKYDIGKYSWVEGAGNLNINLNKIVGDIEITNGNIREIPEFSGEDEAPKLEHDINLNVDINKNVSITLDDIFSVKSIETNIEGSGTLKNDEGFFNLVGTVSLIDGVLTWNQNDFNIESGVIVFDDPYRDIKNLDPSIAISASTNIVNERIQVDLTGYLRDVDIRLSSDSGLTYDQIISLLTFHNKLNETTPEGVVKDFLDNQIRNQIFNPISRKIEEILGISNLTIGSELIKRDAEDNLNFTQDLRLGFHLSLEQPVYKDLLFINTEVQLSEIEPGEISSYDVGVRYKMPGNAGVNFGVRNDAINERVELRLGFEFKKDFLYLNELYTNEEVENE
ncbi:MAG: translocation/assembly module TamB domain-containing protein [Fusobacteriota bacterium]